MRKKLLSILCAFSLVLTPVPVSAETVQEINQEPLVKVLTLSDYQKWSSTWTDDWDFLQNQLTNIVDGAYDAGADPDYMLFGGDFTCLGNTTAESITGMTQVKDIIRSHMNEKEKVTSAEIISRKTDGKPYYGIKYKKVGEDHYTVGYSSYYLDYVIDWLNNCFEFCGESKIVVNVGKDTNVPSNDGWIPVEERLPEDCEEIVLVQVSGKPADNILFDNAFEFALYEKEEGWMLDNYPEWKNPDVIAWQSLPEPYRRFKKELS